MPYRVLLCDADDTLFDFHLSEKVALEKTLQQHRLPSDDTTCKLYSNINSALWKRLEMGEIDQTALKVERFRQLLEKLHSSKDASLLAQQYADNLGQCAFLMPYALDFVKEVAKQMPIYLVTNGISQIQRSRLALSPIKKHIADIIISQEIGAQKPDPKMLHIALEKSGFEKKDAVMLGDSVSSDIPAAHRAGIDSILITWGRALLHPDATYHVSNLKEALRIIVPPKAK